MLADLRASIQIPSSSLPSETGAQRHGDPRVRTKRSGETEPTRSAPDRFDQRDEGTGYRGLPSRFTRIKPRSNQELLVRIAPHWNRHAATRFQLSEQLRGNILRPGRDQDLVVGREPKEPVSTIALKDLNVLGPKSRNAFASLPGQFGEDLNGVHFPHQFPEQRRCVARTSPNFENTVFRGQPKTEEHECNHARLADGLTQSERDCHVFIGLGRAHCRQKSMPRHLGECRKDTLVENSGFCLEMLAKSFPRPCEGLLITLALPLKVRRRHAS